MDLAGAFSKSKQSQDQWSRPGYTKYQEDIQKFLTPQLKDTLMGYDSQLMRSISQLSQNAARQKTLPLRKQFLESYGMPGPAKVDLANKLLPTEIAIGAEAGQSAFKAALEMLAGILGQTPSQFSQSKGRMSSLAMEGSLKVSPQDVAGFGLG